MMLRVGCEHIITKKHYMNCKKIPYELENNRKIIARYIMQIANIINKKIM